MSERASTPSKPSAGITKPVRIASRKSELALVQTQWVMGQLQEHHPGLPLELNTLSTQGDIILDVALAKIGDKGLFTKELEVSLLNGSSDLAVHSLKDLPTRLPEGLVLGAITRREDPLDALVVGEKFRDYRLATLPEGTVIGTSSLRRLAQLRHAFPHLRFKDVRGNLNTRLAKLERGEYDGLILAVAGLKRLGKADRIHEVLDPGVSLYAVGQGSLGIECRQGDERILELGPTLGRCGGHSPLLGRASFPAGFGRRVSSAHWRSQPSPRGGAAPNRYGGRPGWPAAHPRYSDGIHRRSRGSGDGSCRKAKTAGGRRDFASHFCPGPPLGFPIFSE
jgi:hydroxymethylbilane synthase